MKVKLLKRLRKQGRDKVEINIVTKQNNKIIRFKYSFNGDEYSGLFKDGDTEESFYKKAETIYINNYLKSKRK